MFKRGARDKYRPMRLTAIASMCRMLDRFSADKNPQAPIVYRTLIFALIENHQDEVTREMLLTNFLELFDANPNVPIGLVLDPFIKQIQAAEGTTFFFKVFDFDFLAQIAKHPKLPLKNAVEILDMLAKVYINENTYSNAAAVPFMLVSSRFLDTPPVRDFLIKFTSLTSNMLLGLEKARKKNNALPPANMKKTKKMIREEQMAYEKER